MERNEYIPPEEFAETQKEYGERIEGGVLRPEILDQYADVMAMGSSTRELTEDFNQPHVFKVLGDRKRFAERSMEERLRAGRALAKMLKELNPKADVHNIVKSHVAYSDKVAVIDEAFVKEWQKANEIYDEAQKEGKLEDKSSVLNIQRDGLITNLPDYPLYFGTSDAHVVTLFDPENKAIGIFHAGIYSFMNKILASGVRAMKEQYGTDPEKLIAVISPGISEENYNVNEQVQSEFMTKIGEKGAKHIKPSVKTEGETTIDLLGAIREDLNDLGISDTNIQASEYKTDLNNDLFPSARKEGNEVDPFATMVVLK